MARVTRKNQKIFAESATNNGVFGSLQANDPTISNDPDTIQGRTAYSQGWNSATYSSEKLPPLEEFQALQYLFSRQLSYLFQEGISEWNADTTYYIGSIAKSISSGNIKVYMSTVNNNKNHAMTDTTRWMLLFDSTVGYALRDMSNLTDAAKNIAYWSTDLSNCIVSIPQDINLELSAGTLTLKSGSVITAPDGTQLQLTADWTSSSASGSTYKSFVFCSNSGFVGQSASSDVSRVGSGPSLPADNTNYSIFFNSTDNKIYHWSSGAWVERSWSLPIAIVSVTSGVITSIDQVFNGCGYIGASIFVLPGVTGLAPNGFNPDGTLSSTTIKISSLQIYNNTGTNVNNATLIRATTGGLGGGQWTESETLASYGRTYIPSKNRVYQSNGSEQPCFRIADYSLNNVGNIIYFKQMPVVRMAKQEDLDKKQDKATALNYKNVSNCITEIPQDINLTLASDGTLTLKAGSVVTFPDGTQLQKTSDSTRTATYNGTYKAVVFLSSAGNLYETTPIYNVTSGSTFPENPATHAIHYDTTTNKLYMYSTAQATWQDGGFGLPVAIVTVTSDTITSIDQIFNGAGYIGHHAFVLPGISFLRADGKNSDGTLASTLITRTSLNFVELDNSRKVINMSSATSIEKAADWINVKSYNDIKTNIGLAKQYVIDENEVYIYQSGVLNQKRTLLVRFAYNGTDVTQFDIEQPIRFDDKPSLEGNNEFLGNNTFSSSVSLGGSATATTPSSTDNDTSVATSAMVQTAFANAIGTPRDVTILWGNGTGVGTPTEFTLSEDFTNFEQIGYVNADDNEDIRTVFIQSTYWLNYLLQNAGQHSVLLGGDSYGSVCAINGYSNTSNPSTKTKFVVNYENNMSYYIFGINRKVTTVTDPLA